MEILYKEVYREDIENGNLKQELVRKMCKELQIYLLKKKPGYQYKIKNLLQNGHEDPIAALEEEFFLDNPTYLRKFMEIGKNNNYFFKGDIQNIITNLSRSINVGEDIKKWTKLPFISKITFDEENSCFTIISDYGTFQFVSARKTYPNETQKMMEIAKKQDDYSDKLGIDYNCHLVAKEFVRIHKDCYFTSCQCPHIFNNTWWLHSYVLTEDKEYVIDFSNDLIMKKEMFDLLFEPNTLFTIDSYELKKFEDEQIELANQTFDGISALAIKSRAEQLKEKIYTKK